MNSLLNTLECIMHILKIVWVSAYIDLEAGILHSRA